MKKLVMIVVAVLSCVNFAYGYDFEYDGLYYTILSKEDKTVSVSQGSSKPTGDLVIPQRVSKYTTLYTVTEIGSDAFEFCTGLTSVTLPASVMEIGGSAFEYCTSLTSVTLPSSVTKIGLYAFSDCSALTSVAIPSSVTEIGYCAFIGCSDCA